MKILLMTLLLLQYCLVSGQAKYDFKLTKSAEVNINKSINTNSNNRFYFKTDKNHLHLIMYHSNSGCKQNSLKLVDTADYTPYVSNLYSFGSAKDQKISVLLWETEYESSSYIMAYYLYGNQLLKIGELAITLDCQNCDYAGYPIKSIKIQKVDDHIEFSFLEDLDLWIKDDEQKFYKAGTFKYQYDIIQKKLKIIKPAD